VSAPKRVVAILRSFTNIDCELVVSQINQLNFKMVEPFTII